MPASVSDRKRTTSGSVSTISFGRYHVNGAWRPADPPMPGRPHRPVGSSILPGCDSVAAPSSNQSSPFETGTLTLGSSLLVCQIGTDRGGSRDLAHRLAALRQPAAERAR